MTIDLSKLTYREMAMLIASIGCEIKRRNLIFVNAYMQPLHDAVNSVLEIAGGEANNFTSESGPREGRQPRKNCR